MVGTGWIKLHRSLLDWRWFTDGNTLKVWLFLLLRANVSPHGFEGITINRGQLATSYNSIASQTNLTYEQVRTAIRHLKSTGEITVLRKSNFLVVSIPNYERYQWSIPDLDTDKSQSLPNHFPITTQQYKNDKNNKKEDDEDWEDKMDVPAQFRGRFPNIESYLAYTDRRA